MRVVWETVTGIPVDCRPALRQIDFREKYELLLWYVGVRWGGTPVWRCLPDDPVVHNPRGPRTVQGEEHTVSQLLRQERGLTRAVPSVAFSSPGQHGGWTGKEWNWEGGWAPLLDQPVPKWTLQNLLPQPHFPIKIPLRNTEQNVDNYSPMWQRHMYSTEQ